MKIDRKLMVMVIVVVLGVAASLMLAQDEEELPFGPPTHPLVECPTDMSDAMTPCDMIATKAEDIAGVWIVYFNAELGYVRFNADGTFEMGDAPDRIPGDSSVYPTGTFTVDENGVFASSDPIDLPDGQCTTGTYIARVIKVGDQKVALDLAVQEDCFAPRRLDYAYDMLWVSGE